MRNFVRSFHEFCAVTEKLHYIISMPESHGKWTWLTEIHHQEQTAGLSTGAWLSAQVGTTHFGLALDAKQSRGQSCFASDQPQQYGSRCEQGVLVTFSSLVEIC